MRKVIFVIFILLMPSVFANHGEEWTVEVEDPFGNPISGCEITLRDPWTGAELSHPSRSMYQPSAICEGYVVMWHPPIPSSQTVSVLQAYPITEDLFTVQGANKMQVLGSDWNVSITNGSVDAPSGVPIVLSGPGGSAVRNSESSITIPEETTTYNLSNNYTKDVLVAAFNTGTGEIIPWVEQNLTVGEFGGGWSARVVYQGIPIGNSTWPPTVEWVESQINYSSLNGSANLEITSQLNENENFSGTWQAHHLFNTGFGLPFIPGQEAGIESQVNRFLDGDVNNLEMLLESLVYTNGVDALCCVVDDDTVVFTNLVIQSEIDFSSGYWGWNESGEVSGERSHISLVRLEVPFQNDIRQTTPLQISTNGEYQYVSSPLDEWIDGTSSNFTLYRDGTSISGFYTITLGPNSAPIVSISEDYALPWENTSYDFIPAIEDSPLSVHDCTWDIAGSSQNLSVNLSQFNPDSEINISLTCTDEGGLSGHWNGSLILDDGYPEINASNEIQEIPPGQFKWDLMVGDDHDNNLRVYWTSNKSLDWWYTGDLLLTTFDVDSNLNSIYDNITERHKARNNVEYWLAAEVTDDVGHSTFGNWTLKLIDVAPPVVIADLEAQDPDNGWNSSEDLFLPNDKIRLNLTESFDDHSSIDKIKFSIRIYNEYFANLSWSEAQFFEIKNPGVGYHQVIIEATDEMGNTASTNVGIAISPSTDIDLQVINIKSAGSEIEPGENGFWITVQNNGATTTEFLLCSDGECVESIVGPSSFIRNTTAIVYMNVDLGWFETFNVELSYLDENNDTISKYSTSEYSSGMGIGTVELLIFVMLAVLGIIWFRSRNEPRF